MGIVLCSDHTHERGGSGDLVPYTARERGFGYGDTRLSTWACILERAQGHGLVSPDPHLSWVGSGHETKVTRD